MKKICLFVLIFILSVTMTACGSAGGNYYPDSSDTEKGIENIDRTDSVAVGSDRKMTRSISISAETEDFNLLSDRIRSAERIYRERKNQRKRIFERIFFKKRKLHLPYSRRQDRRISETARFGLQNHLAVRKLKRRYTELY